MKKFNSPADNDVFLKAKREDVVASSYSTWTEPGLGMLDTRWLLKDAPEEVQDFAHYFLKKSVYCRELLTCPEVYCLLKTKDYFTEWHFNVTDKPSFIVLVQVTGKTVLMSAPGFVGGVFGSKMRNVGVPEGLKYFFTQKKRTSTHWTQEVGNFESRRLCCCTSELHP